MGKQKIEVSINCPDKEVLQKLMAKAIADIVVNRIKSADIKQREIICERILKELNCKGNEDIYDVNIENLLNST